MKSLGGNLIFFGLGSIVLYFLNMEFILLSWIDHWGENIGWGIRIGITVIGAALWLIGHKKETAAVEQ